MGERPIGPQRGHEERGNERVGITSRQGSRFSGDIGHRERRDRCGSARGRGTEDLRVVVGYQLRRLRGGHAALYSALTSLNASKPLLPVAQGSLPSFPRSYRITSPNPPSSANL